MKSVKSASKKTRKRVHSPDKDILPTPKKIRSKHPANTPVVEDTISSRPVTRSSNTPLLSIIESLPHGSGRRYSTTDQTLISSCVAQSVGRDDEVESRGDSTAACTGTTNEAVKTSSTISVDRPEFVTASTTRRRTSSRATRPNSIGKSNIETIPPNRRSSHAPASVTHHSIDDMHSRPEFGTGRHNLETINSSEPHNRNPSNTLEPFGSTLGVYIRFSRILVILTILLFAFVSLVRLDHDKHDTHGSVSRSGRKMYSFLTLGFVQPWEWGIRRKDLILHADAESLLAQSMITIDEQARQENRAAALLDVSDKVAGSIRKTLNEITTMNTITRTREASVKDITRRNVTSTCSTMLEGLSSSLSQFHAEVRKHCASELSLYVSSAVGFDSQVVQVFDTVNRIKQRLCTTQSCALWHDYRISLKDVHDEIRANSFDGEASSQFKFFIRNKLWKLAEQGMSNKIAPIAIRYVEDVFRQAEPMCTVAATGSNMDTVTCLEKTIATRVDDMFGDEKIESGSYIDLSRRRDINGNSDTGGDRSSLEATVYDLIHSSEMRKDLRATLLHREMQFRNICISRIKSFVKENKLERKNDLGQVDDPSHMTSDAESFLINFALATRGSLVVHSSVRSLHSLTSPPYSPNLLTSVGLSDGYGDASVVLSSTIPRNRGDCYAFEGSSGNLTILLPGPTHISRVAVYQRNGVVMDAFAVRVFRVYGWPELPHTAQHESDGFTISNSVFLGEFSMESQFQETSSTGMFHEFSFNQEWDNIPLPRLQAVTIQFDENFGGGNFTCVYRVQLLGEP